MAFIGKWYQYEHTGLEDFAKANAGDIAKVLPMLPGFSLTGPDGYVEEMSPAEGGINRKVYVKGDLKRDVTAPLGKEFDGTSWDGRACKILVEKCADGTVKRTESHPDGAKVVSIVSGSGADEATITIEGKGVKCVRKFKRC